MVFGASHIGKDVASVREFKNYLRIMTLAIYRFLYRHSSNISTECLLCTFPGKYKVVKRIVTF